MSDFAGIPLSTWIVGIVPLASTVIWAATVTNRVKVLEQELLALKPLQTICTRLETKMDALETALREFNEGTRWMRPAPAEIGAFDPFTGRRRDHAD